MSAWVKTNAAQFSNDLDDFLVEFGQAAASALRGLSVQAFRFVLAETGQDYGTATANWKYSVGAADTSYDATLFRQTGGDDRSLNPPGGGGQIKGSSPAIDYAWQANAGRSVPVTAYSQVFISNSLEKDGDAYVQKIEAGSFLREANRPGRMVARAAENFNNIGTISPALLAALKGEVL